MGFFNDIGKKTSETTSKIAKEAKLKMKINENKSKIKELYERIGSNIYEKYVQKEDADKSLIDDICKEIDELSSANEEARREILILNHKKICENCFAEMEDDAMFCPKCGEKQEEKVDIEKTEEEAKEVEVLPKDEDNNNSEE